MGVSIRTAQRLEKFGLPVRRPAGSMRSATVAIPAELDAWRRTYGLTIIPTSVQALAEVASDGDGHHGWSLRRRKKMFSIIEGDIRHRNERAIALRLEMADLRRRLVECRERSAQLRDRSSKLRGKAPFKPLP